MIRNADRDGSRTVRLPHLPNVEKVVEILLQLGLIEIVIPITKSPRNLSFILVRYKRNGENRRKREKRPDKIVCMVKDQSVDDYESILTINKFLEFEEKCELYSRGIMTDREARFETESAEKFYVIDRNENFADILDEKLRYWEWSREKNRFLILLSIH